MKLKELINIHKIKILVGIIILLLAILAILIAYIIMKHDETNNNIVTPYVSGMTIDEAENILENSGFVIKEIVEKEDHIEVLGLTNEYMSAKSIKGGYIS